MLVNAKLERKIVRPGAVVVEPGVICGHETGLQMEETVVEPDADGWVSVMVANT